MTKFAAASEKALIGGLLLTNQRVRDKHLDDLKPDWLGCGVMRRICRIVIDKHSAGQQTDLALLMDVPGLSGDDFQTAAEAVNYLDQGIVPASAPQHIKRIRDAWVARESEQVLQALEVCQTVEDQHAQLTGALERIESVQAGNTAGPVTMMQAGKRWLELVEQAKSGEPRITTGVSDLDRRIGGLMPGDMCVIAARPGVGKTALLTQIAGHVSKERAVLIFSLEMTRDQIVSRMVTQATGSPDVLRALRSGHQDTEEMWMATTAAMGDLSKRKLFVDDRPSLDVSEIEIVARSYVRKHGVALIAIDYLQLARCRTENRFQEVSEISRRLKGLAKTCGVPLIALSQLRRPQGAVSVDREPSMNDLRESGQIEQDADQVILLHRDTHDSTKPGKFITDKNRHGEPGIDHFQWVAAKQIFGACSGDGYARSGAGNFY